MKRRYSIITITWNNAGGLVRTLGSIRSQQYKDYELIVIDGKSSDDTPAVLIANEDIITHSVSEKDSGIYNAMNKGLQYVTGDYVVFMNAGDCFASPETLSTVNGYDGDIILGGARYGESVRLPEASMTLYDVIALGINHQSTYYRSDIIRRYPFDESMKITADHRTVCEPLAREQVRLSCVREVLSVCEDGGQSKQLWKGIYAERAYMLREIMPPFYYRDYARLSKIHPSLIDDFGVISRFAATYKVVHAFAALLRFVNRYTKKIPLE